MLKTNKTQISPSEYLFVCFRKLKTVSLEIGLHLKRHYINFRVQKTVRIRIFLASATFLFYVLLKQYINQNLYSFHILESRFNEASVALM